MNINMNTSISNNVNNFNYPEKHKHTRSLSSSLPNRSHLNLNTNSADETETKTNQNSCIIFNTSTKNPPVLAKKVTSDDGSGTKSISKNININTNQGNNNNIINNRRKSESFAEYSGQEFFMSSPNSDGYYEKDEEGDHQDNFNNNANDFFLQVFSDDASFLSPDALNHHFYPHGVPNLDKKVILYKTEMCRTFEETGICKYGTKCQFAHDYVEVRNIPRHPRYKTEICKTFWQMGNCPYGKRCCFIHTENELREKTTTMSNNTALHQQMQTNNNENDDDQDISDIYGSVDMTIQEDSIVGEIQSQNSSRSISPSKLAEDLKRTINNVGLNSIFNNLSLSNLASTTTTMEGKFSFFKLVNQNARFTTSDNEINTNNSTESESSDLDDSRVLSSQDPEFKNIQSSNFGLWSGVDSPTKSDELNSTDRNKKIEKENGIETNSVNTLANEFSIFDKSPGSRKCSVLTGGIWSKTTGLTLPSIANSIENSNTISNTISSFSGISSKSTISSTQSNQEQLLIDMLNLLDSAQ